MGHQSPVIMQCPVQEIPDLAHISYIQVNFLCIVCGMFNVDPKDGKYAWNKMGVATSVERTFPGSNQMRLASGPKWKLLPVCDSSVAIGYCSLATVERCKVGKRWIRKTK